MTSWALGWSRSSWTPVPGTCGTPTRRLRGPRRRWVIARPFASRRGCAAPSSGCDPMPEGRLRVARVISRLNVGGPARHAILLTAGLDPAAFESRLYVGAPGPAEGDMLPLAEARRVHPVAIPWLGRAPVTVHTFHGHVLRGYFSPPLTATFRAVERALARRTTRIVALSPAQRADLLAMGIGRPRRVAVVPLGLELDPFLEAQARRGALRRRLGLPPEAKLVGAVARLV